MSPGSLVSLIWLFFSRPQAAILWKITPTESSHCHLAPWSPVSQLLLQHTQAPAPPVLARGSLSPGALQDPRVLRLHRCFGCSYGPLSSQGFTQPNADSVQMLRQVSQGTWCVVAAHRTRGAWLLHPWTRALRLPMETVFPCLSSGEVMFGSSTWCSPTKSSGRRGKKGGRRPAREAQHKLCWVILHETPVP
jgi:hypothetical protein